MKHTLYHVLYVLALAVGGFTSSAREYENARTNSILLNGPWEYQVVRDLQPPPDNAGWKACTVPGVLHGYDYQRAWFRRSFTVPPNLRGKRLKLNFGGVKFNSQVLLNGKPVGGCFGG